MNLSAPNPAYQRGLAGIPIDSQYQTGLTDVAAPQYLPMAQPALPLANLLAQKPTALSPEAQARAQAGLAQLRQQAAQQPQQAQHTPSERRTFGDRVAGTWDIIKENPISYLAGMPLRFVSTLVTGKPNAFGWGSDITMASI